MNRLFRIDPLTAEDQHNSWSNFRGSRQITYHYLDATYTTNAWVCVDLSFGGEDWSIDISFFIDTYYLGYDDYLYLLENQELGGETYPCSGTSSPSPQDQLRQQYVDSNLAYIPACADFQYQPTTAHFAWSQVQSHAFGTTYDPFFDYALFRSTLSSGLETLYADTAFTITTSNRIYSTPHHNYAAIAHPARNSRHVYGDAADIQTAASDTAHWQPLRNHAYNLSPRPCAEPANISGFNHVHLDYRAAAGAFNQSASCPTGYNLP